MNPISTETLDDTLSALAAFLENAEAAPEHLVLIGGAALLALRLVSRTTRDVDIIAGVDPRVGLVDPRPMSEALTTAADKVARELDLDPHWLNTGPADHVLAGLPDGFLTRLSRRDYGAHPPSALEDPSCGHRTRRSDSSRGHGGMARQGGAAAEMEGTRQ